MTAAGKKLFYAEYVSSENFNRVTLKHGENPHSVTILPNKPDGTIYTGIVTFTATKPVEVGISHRLPIDNSTFSNLIQRHSVISISVIIMIKAKPELLVF